VKSAFKWQLLGAVLTVGASLAVTGCKSAPELTQADAQKLIQAYYDQQPAEPVHIYVDYTGLKQVYKLDDGSTTIHWRPDEQNKGHFYVTTVQTTHPRISEVSDPQDDVVPGVDTAKSCKFSAGDNLEGLPDTVKHMAHNVGNTLSQRHTADFALDNGAWKVHAIR